MILNDLQELLPKYKIKKISEEDYDNYYNLLLSNNDFFIMTEGKTVTFEEAVEDTFDLPPNTTMDQKFYICFYDNEKLIAVMDYIEHYPSKGIVFIGFFMINNNEKRKKLGTKIINEFVRALKKNGISKMQLACLDINHIGLHFWKSFNMYEVRRAISKKENRPDWNIIVFEKEIFKMKNTETLVKQYTEILNEKKETCKKNCDALTKDSRKDEADLEKIKLNIYDIFNTFIGVAQREISKKAFTDENLKYEAFCNEYLHSFDKIPESWRVKLEKAKENNDVINIVIEENKLSVAAELKNIFSKLM